MVIYLERAADWLHMVQLMPLHPHTPIISCLIYIQTDYTFPVTAYPGHPGKRPLNGCSSSSSSGSDSSSKTRLHIPMECMSPLSMLALRRLDMASTVQFRRADRLLTGHFLNAPSVFSSVESSEQSFSRFMNSVKYLQ